LRQTRAFRSADPPVAVAHGFRVLPAEHFHASANPRCV
jgi:hypothetical protein